MCTFLRFGQTQALTTFSFLFLMKIDKGRHYIGGVQYWFCPPKSDHRGNGDSIATLYYFQQPSTFHCALKLEKMGLQNCLRNQTGHL